MTDLYSARVREKKYYDDEDDDEYEEEEERPDVSEEGMPESDYEMELVEERDNGKSLYQIKEDYVMYESDI